MKNSFKTQSPKELKVLQESYLKEIIRFEFGMGGQKINMDKHTELHTLPSTEDNGLVRTIVSYKCVPFAFMAVHYDGHTFRCSVQKLSESEIAILRKTSKDTNKILFGNENTASLSEQTEINKLLASCPASVFVSLKEFLELRKLTITIGQK